MYYWLTHLSQRTFSTRPFSEHVSFPFLLVHEIEPLSLCPYPARSPIRVLPCVVATWWSPLRRNICFYLSPSPLQSLTTFSARSPTRSSPRSPSCTRWRRRRATAPPSTSAPPSSRNASRRPRAEALPGRVGDDLVAATEPEPPADGHRCIHRADTGMAALVVLVPYAEQYYAGCVFGSIV